MCRYCALTLRECVGRTGGSVEDPATRVGKAVGRSGRSGRTRADAFREEASGVEGLHLFVSKLRLCRSETAPMRLFVMICSLMPYDMRVYCEFDLLIPNMASC